MTAVRLGTSLQNRINCFKFRGDPLSDAYILSLQKQLPETESLVDIVLLFHKKKYCAVCKYRYEEN